MYDSNGYYDDGDDWSDMKYYGPDSENLEDLGEASQLCWESYAGSGGDQVSYGMFYFDGPARLSFSLESEDASFSLTVYALVGRPGAYSLKALQTTTTKKKVQRENGSRYVSYVNVTAPLLVNKSSDTTTTLYLAVRPTNPQYEMDFTVSINEEDSCFFEKAQNGYKDDWTDRTVNGPNSKQLNGLEVDPTNYGELYDDWIGMGDAIDFRKFTLNTYAKVSLAVLSSASNVQLYLCKLAGSYGRYSLKPLSTATVKYDANSFLSNYCGVYKEEKKYIGITKSLFLGAGEYYIAVLSKNAAKGGSADYTVAVSQIGSAFYKEAENGWVDDWKDLKRNGAASTYIGESFAPEDHREYIFSDDCFGWVGMGDAIDYKRLSMNNPGQLSFTVYASDSVLFTIYSLVGEKGNYSLKKLQSSLLTTKESSIWAPEGYFPYMVKTKSLLLGKGEYYISLQSTNANKGGNAKYIIWTSDNSSFYYDVDNGWNGRILDSRNRLAPEYDNLLDNSTVLYGGEGELNFDNGYYKYYYLTDNDTWCAHNCVGLGDELDYKMIELNGTSKVSFTIEAMGAVKFFVYQLVEGRNDTYSQKLIYSGVTSQKKWTLTEGYYDARGRYKTKQVSYSYYGLTTNRITLSGGEYFLCVQSSSAKNYCDAYYNVSYNCSYPNYSALTGPEPDLAMPAADVQDIQDDLLAGMSSAETFADVSAASALQDCSLLQESAGLLA